MKSYLSTPHKAYFKTVCDEPACTPVLKTEYVTLWETDEGLVITSRVFVGTIGFLRPYYYKAQCRLKNPVTMLAKWTDVFAYTRRNTIESIQLAESKKPVKVTIATKRFEKALIQSRINAEKCKAHPRRVYNFDDRESFYDTGYYCVRSTYIYLLTLTSSKHYYFKKWIRFEQLHKLSICQENEIIKNFVEQEGKKREKTISN